jgi:maleylacetoacetate isomerase/maleylpyruvate isomerase
MTKTVLYGYYRSSAAYRVRIGLALKGIAYEQLSVHLAKGEQRAPEYLALNPQGFVPALAIDGLLLTQSQAILEYLDETRPQPAFLPNSPADRALVRRMAQAIVADIHPLNNARILAYLKAELSQDETGVNRWIHRWIGAGFTALESLIAPRGTAFCFGDRPGMADIMLVPQMYNARRFSMDLSPFPTLCAIDERCAAIAEFAVAHPDRQPDAPSP